MYFLEGYERTFDWKEYSIETKSIVAPANFFSYQQFISDKNECHRICSFKEGMLLEAVDIVHSDVISLALIKRVAGRLLQLHFIGCDDVSDQWYDCCSPNIFPVGYSDLIGHPLQILLSKSKKVEKSFNENNGDQKC